MLRLTSNACLHGVSSYVFMTEFVIVLHQPEIYGKGRCVSFNIDQIVSNFLLDFNRITITLRIFSIECYSTRSNTTHLVSVIKGLFV